MNGGGVFLFKGENPGQVRRLLLLGLICLQKDFYRRVDPLIPLSGQASRMGIALVFSSFANATFRNR